MGVDRVHSVMDSPVGPLTLVADDGVLSGLYMDQHRHGPLDAASAAGMDAVAAAFGPFGAVDAAPFRAVVEQLEAYFAGSLTEFDLELAPVGTPFQLRVWRALRDIPFGRTVSYGHIAAEVGQPGSARAVGLANGRNPISIIVPCHRVIGADGSLTGYGGGIERKRFLLDMEHRVSQGALF